MPDALTVYQLHGFAYERQERAEFPLLKLGLTLWQGTFEGKGETWLRWVDEAGRVIPTGRERAEEERRLAEAEHQRAEEERRRAEEAETALARERERASRLAEMLRQLGHDPDQF
jgi:hypothetical protein